MKPRTFWTAAVIGLVGITAVAARGSGARPLKPAEQLVPVAERDAYFDSNGVRLRYVEQGRGDPIILLHGFILNAKANWIDGGVLEALSRKYRVVAVDLRGHGQSGKPHDAGSYGLEMVNDVVRLMNHLKLKRAHVIGYSLGGIVALKLIEVAPDSLRSLVLGGAGWVREGDQRWTGLAGMLDKIQPGETISSHFWPDANARPPREVQQIVDDNDPVALAALARGMPMVVVSEKVLRSNRVPVLALFGDQDPQQADGAFMKGVAKNFAMRVIPGLDHNTLAGSEEFRRAVLEFVAQAN